MNLTRPPRRAARVASLAIVAVMAAACGTTPPSPSTSPSSTPDRTFAPTPTPGASGGPSASPGANDALFDEIQAQVLDIRGLEPADVTRQTIDAAALQAYNETSFDEDNPPDYVAANERLYKALGLMPADATLRGLFLELIDSQVAGFYRPDEKTLFVVSRTGRITGADKITFAHEYDHALQDASFDVFEGQQDLLDQTDTALARAAIFEGDATVLMLQWAGPNLTPEEFQEVIAAGADPEALAVLQRTPAILVQSLLFPYTAGQAFVAPVQGSAGWAGVDALYADLPASTEQILHPDKYRSGEAPIDVSLPDLAADLGAGWTEGLQDTLGEYQYGIWLGEADVPTSEATAAAAGWGGDRVAVLTGPNDTWAVVMRSEWDTPDDAAQFEAAAEVAVDAATGSAAVLPGEGGTTRWFLVASDDPTLEAVAGALGLAG